MADSIQDNNYMVNDLAAKGKQEFFPGQVLSCTQQGPDFLFTCDNGVQLSVQVITDKILRFRYATEVGFAADFSYAVLADQPGRRWSFWSFARSPTITASPPSA
ncbi:alpha-glucosidase domain-containing protein [Hymenobacter cellulosilyticus]|uniref:DUF4968 domain-containing protein n=1 Tax=Hymenobacter cellulosilyticus TaxID=2932248 RepID=A0A8T9Q327_9BACT|nr:alpha-glucosidase domain-containing protein [Hymenobacter cellulosilyticus]UOQ71934.1 DUF4968 domain-containing protein [Hymenobacter cellulosilyticus]